MAAPLNYFTGPEWTPLPQYQLTPSGKPIDPAASPLAPTGGGMTLQPFPLNGRTGPLGTPLFPGNTNPVQRPGQPQAPGTPPMGGFGGFGGMGDSGPSFAGPPDGYSAPGAAGGGTTGGQGMAATPVSFSGRGGVGGFMDMAGDAMRGDTGRNALTALSTLGYAVPNPVSTAAGVIGAGVNAYNVSQNANQMGQQGYNMTLPQIAGGVLGLNGYNGSLANAMNAAMGNQGGRDVYSGFGMEIDPATGQVVTAPPPNLPTEVAGPLANIEVSPLGDPGLGGFSDFSGGDQSVSVDGINYSPGDFGFW